MIPPASLPGARRQAVAAGRGAARWLDRVMPPGAMLSEAFLRPVAGILLLGDPRLALPVWLVLLLDPRLALGGLLGLAVGHGLRQALRDEANSIPGGSIGTNAFLAGLAAAWITRFSGAGIVAELVLILGAAAMASVLALALRRALAGTTLPPMVWAYCATAALLFGLFPEWALRAILATDWGQAPASMADWWSALLRSFGAFLFSPNPLAGMAIALAILAWSRIMFACGLIGWAAGVLVALGFLALGERFCWLPASYNFFLAGMALGASVFLPARRTLVLVAAAGAFASVVSIGMQYMLAWSPAAYLPIPFGLSVWVGIGSLRRTATNGLFVATRIRDRPRRMPGPASASPRAAGARASRSWSCRWAAPCRSPRASAGR
ncbi:MAG: urea transporter [Alphaproteobacteria bacterium]|nr:urea transporter [Alphaproteobacteria bacterium]